MNPRAQATLHLLFLPGFTVDAAAFEDEPEDALVPERALWAPGLGGFEARPAASLALDRNRAEVLRLLLACACEPLYLGLAVARGHPRATRQTQIRSPHADPGNGSQTGNQHDAIT